MNNIIAFNLPAPSDVAVQIAARVKARRLELNLTQEGLATRAGLNKNEAIEVFDRMQKVVRRYR